MAIKVAGILLRGQVQQAFLYCPYLGNSHVSAPKWQADTDSHKSKEYKIKKTRNGKHRANLQYKKKNTV